MTQDSLERIIIVAGPTCCGKTRFIDNLMSGKSKDLEEILQIDVLNDWFYHDVYYCKKDTLHKLLINSKKKVILHWTIPLPRLKIFLRNILLFGAYDKKVRLNLVKSTKKIIVVTLYVDQATLLQRLKKRKLKRKREAKIKKISLFKKLLILHNTKTVERFYKNPKRYLPLYSRWFEFVEKELVPEKHYLINVDNKPIVKTINDWAKITNR